MRCGGVGSLAGSRAPCAWGGCYPGGDHPSPVLPWLCPWGGIWPLLLQLRGGPTGRTATEPESPPGTPTPGVEGVPREQGMLRRGIPLLGKR